MSDIDALSATVQEALTDEDDPAFHPAIDALFDLTRMAKQAEAKADLLVAALRQTRQEIVNVRRAASEAFWLTGDALAKTMEGQRDE